MSPRALAAPLHRHTREDEYSYVLEGRMGALLGDEVLEAGPGDLVHKPRDQWHTFWNAGDEPCRILEIIAPAGFEDFFRELDGLGGALKPTRRARALNERYGLGCSPTPCRVCSSASASDRRAALVGLDDRQHVAGRVLEPGDRGAVAVDPPVVLVEALVALELHASGHELVDRRLDVLDGEVEDRVFGGRVVRPRVGVGRSPAMCRVSRSFSTDVFRPSVSP